MNRLQASESIEVKLRKNGMRITPQRLAVAELMLKNPVHMTPQKVYETLHGRLPSLSPNTVYLTLDHFEQSGLLKRIFIDGKAVFDSRTDRHDHAYCRQCGTIQDLPGSSVKVTPLTIKRWHIDAESRVWSGRCPACCETEADA